MELLQTAMRLPSKILPKISHTKAVLSHRLHMGVSIHTARPQVMEQYSRAIDKCRPGRLLHSKTNQYILIKLTRQICCPRLALTPPSLPISCRQVRKGRHCSKCLKILHLTGTHRMKPLRLLVAIPDSRAILPCSCLEEANPSRLTAGTRLPAPEQCVRPLHDIRPCIQPRKRTFQRQQRQASTRSPRGYPSPQPRRCLPRQRSPGL